MNATEISIGLDAVIVAVTDEVPLILTVTPTETGGAGETGLPSGPFDPGGHRTLELGLRTWVDEQTGLSLGYVEQLYTFGDRYRDPRELSGGPRIISIGYLALVREVTPRGHPAAGWRSWYEFFPWEDWRNGRPAVIDSAIRPALQKWVYDSPDAGIHAVRSDRVSICFGVEDAVWDPERVLERYELLYEANLIAEARPGRNTDKDMEGAPMLGLPLALDHRRILATAFSRLRGKLKYRPVVFELLPGKFTLLRLQQVVEALSGIRLHKQNFRRLVLNTGLVEPTSEQQSETGGRPAKLFRFRREVLRERPAPGVGLPRH